MGKTDTLAKKYISDNKIFADAFNFYLYNGRQVIKPEQLHPMDTTAIAVPFEGNGKGHTVQKYRDVIKYMTAMKDSRMAYLVLGIENQAKIHYAMPPRNLLYDAMEYTRQVERTAARHREKKDMELTSGEYLSGFHRKDKLIPVITLVVYFGAKPWDAPRSLHEMFDVQDEQVLSYVNDYKLNLMVPAELSETDFEKFHTNLREVMQYIQYSSDKEKLSALLENDNRFSRMERNAAMLLNECTKSGLKFHESGGQVDMCKAIKDLRQEEYQDGHNAGLKAGREEGHKEGSRLGREKAVLDSIKALMKNMSLSAEQAMDILEIPKTDRPIYHEKL